MKKIIELWLGRFIIVVFVISVVYGLIVGTLNQDKEKGIEAYFDSFNFLFTEPAQEAAPVVIEKITEHGTRRAQRLQPKFENTQDNQ